MLNGNINIDNDPSILGKFGPLSVKIASTSHEVEAALRLRFDVFSQELAISQNALKGLDKDEDRFDQFCDHLIVIDDEKSYQTNAPHVVATYRLLDQDQAHLAGGFYSDAEFKINDLIDRHKTLRFLEFGRSCVAAGYRDKKTVELLWHGSWAHVCKGKYDVMFGCASFYGTDPRQHAPSLQFLAENAAPEAEWDVEARTSPVLLNPSPSSGFKEPQTATLSKMRSGLKNLPPIIKGYLGLGAMFASQAYIDHLFGTLDVLVVLPVERINPRYLRYFGETANRHAPR